LTGRHPRQRLHHLRISLLDGFRVEEDGVSVLLPDGSQHLLAYLALKGRSVRRAVAAGTLWPTVTEDHASSSLRSELRRLSPAARAGVFSNTKEIGLSDDVTVDLWDSRELAHLVTAPERSSPASEPDVEAVASPLARDPARLVRRLGPCRGRGLATGSPPRPRGACGPPLRTTGVRRRCDGCLGRSARGTAS
jgi:hypothetical protein